jgi:hypothetical protein
MQRKVRPSNRFVFDVVVRSMGVTQRDTKLSGSLVFPSLHLVAAILIAVGEALSVALARQQSPRRSS